MSIQTLFLLRQRRSSRRDAYVHLSVWSTEEAAQISARNTEWNPNLLEIVPRQGLVKDKVVFLIDKLYQDGLPFNTHLVQETVDNIRKRALAKLTEEERQVLYL